MLSSNLMKTHQINNPKLMSDHIINLSETRSKQEILNQLGKVDEQLYQMTECSPRSKIITNQSYLKQGSLNSSMVSSVDYNTGQLASSFYNTSAISLGVPKNNSLTDSFLRSTLGCQQKLAKSYLQILDQTDITEQLQRQKRIEEAKKRFAQSNNHKDFYANCKPFMDKTIAKTYLKKSQPVVDNEHQSFLKTHMLYIQKPLIGSKKLTEKQYYDKHADVVAKKINQIGGIQDTVGHMEDSLSRNQLKNFTKRSQFGNNSPNPYSRDKSQNKKTNSKDNGNSWVDRSKSIRQALMTKFDIE